ncbi:hypothetical protein SLEP1_g6170 [Rubroshorea leprosula]|uniref:Subtilisin-like protease SBT5.6 n=2 Tax=Rubroshorea leprosula TaxID=152421 RepID=A0AAV5I372_9ROSI|nr:hypothetical protein SLEP1_g6170 [Rubroshorea leprosula]
MNNISSPIFSLFLFLPLLASCAQKQVYIVYFGEHSGEKALHEIEETHHSYLLSVKETEEDARASLIYSYKHSINGFSAVLTPDEASKLSELEEVVSVVPSKVHTVQTTRSWEFLGLNEAKEPSLLNRRMGDEILLKSKYGENVIIGMIDNGVWPESRSFSDEGMGPVPKSWKGICQSGDAFNSSHCNKKIIGARYYIKDYEQQFGPLNRTADFLSPRDVAGHGTHTASTAAGRRVPTVARGGYASGVASGGAPMARLAIYKACWVNPPNVSGGINMCMDADMLAAIDDAIADGVHVLSISIGTSTPTDYTDDGIAIGALHAVKHNIVVVCAAGNSGPTPATLSNPAPWIITVGASTVDRELSSPLLLGNGTKIMGQGITSYKLNKKTMYPLVYGGDVVNSNGAQNVSTIGRCLPNTLSPKKVRGKIVLCMRGLGSRVEKGLEVKRAGGVGFILANNKVYGNDMTLDDHLLPQTSVIYDDALRILRYINSTTSPTATIMPGKTILHKKPAPTMAPFTSQGPNVIDLNILKPDVTAPGVDILAAWSGRSSPTGLPADHRVIEYYFDSGTSMATPHVAGVAALLRAIHPKWSSAAIRSALITTAETRNNMGQPISDMNGTPATPFQFGAGHSRPTKAADPGLVYDASFTDYILYLCSAAYKKLNNTIFKCPNSPPSTLDLNYPSFAIPNLNRTVTIKRTVTNVGSKKSIYFFSSRPPVGVSVKANPSILQFNHVNQKKSFTITVSPRHDPTVKKNEYGFGWYTWTDGHYIVRSTMAVSLV